MTVFDAGTSRAKWELDTSAGDRAIQQMIRRLTELEKLQQRVLGGAAQPPRAPRPVGPQQDAARAAREQARAEQEAVRSAERLARERAQTATATARQAAAEQRAARELANRTAAEERAAAAALRRRQIEERGGEARRGGAAPPRAFAGFAGVGSALQFAGGVAGGLGIAVGVAELGRFALSAGQASLALDQTLALTRELAGDTTTYATVLEAARRQQELYGGSVQENIAGIQGLVITARSSGAELSTLIDLSQRLSLLDPSQGVSGSRIALSEALAGDPRSLALRYEIPRDALARLTDESLSTEERLLVLDEYLNRIGITSEAISKTVSDTAVTYNRLSGAIDGATTALGRFLAEAGKLTASDLDLFLRTGQGDRDAEAELRTRFQNPFNPAAVTPEAIAANRQRIAEQEVERDGFGAGRGRALQNAARGRASRGELDALDARLRAIQAEAVAVSSTSNAAADAVRAATQAFAQTGDIDAYALAIRQAGVESELTGRAVTQSAQQTAAAERARAAAQQEAATQQEAVEAAARRVADGLSTQAGEVAALIAAYPQLAGQAEQLISAQVRVEEAARAAAVALGQQRLAAQAENTVTQRAQTAGGPGTRGNTLADFDRFLQEQAAIQAARDEQVRLFGSEADRVALAQREYADAVKRFGRESAQAVNAETALRQARGEGQSGRTTRTPRAGIDRDDRAELALLDDQTRLQELQARLAREANQESTRALELKAEIAKLEKDIADEQERQLKASIDARLNAVRDEQQRQQENREIRGLERGLARGTLTDEQRRAAELRIQEIELERAQRAAEIGRQVRDAGGALTQPLPLPSIPSLPPLPTGRAPAAAGAPATGAGDGRPLVVQLVAPNGQVLAEQALPFIIARLDEGDELAGLAGGRG